MKQTTILLLCACALVPALAAGIPALAQTSQDTPETTQATTGGIGPASFPQAQAASAREQRAYHRWRRKLDRHGVRHGRDLVAAARIYQRPPTSDELRNSISRMKARFRRFLASEDGRSIVFRFKVKRIPAWGRQQLRSIARV